MRTGAPSPRRHQRGWRAPPSARSRSCVTCSTPPPPYRDGSCPPSAGTPPQWAGGRRAPSSPRCGGQGAAEECPGGTTGCSRRRGQVVSPNPWALQTSVVRTDTDRLANRSLVGMLPTRLRLRRSHRGRFRCFKSHQGSCSVNRPVREMSCVALFIQICN